MESVENYSVGERVNNEIYELQLSVNNELPT